MPNRGDYIRSPGVSAGSRSDSHAFLFGSMKIPNLMQEAQKISVVVSTRRMENSFNTLWRYEKHKQKIYNFIKTFLLHQNTLFHF